MIDVLIPARNEADTLGPIIDAFYYWTYVRRVFVVDDMSTDATKHVALKHRAIVLNGPGQGKGQAVRYGVECLRTERVVLCDGDLSGFTEGHAHILLYGVPYLFSGRYMLVGVPDFTPNVPWAADNNTWMAVAGNRNVPVDMLSGLDLHGYAMEVQINHEAAKRRMTIIYARLEGVTGKVRDPKTRMDELQRDKVWLARHARTNGMR
jgi:glycosyltransferase involved in cell wall biosynthesis